MAVDDAPRLLETVAERVLTAVDAAGVLDAVGVVVSTGLVDGAADSLADGDGDTEGVPVSTGDLDAAGEVDTLDVGDCVDDTVSLSVDAGVPDGVAAPVPVVVGVRLGVAPMLGVTTPVGVFDEVTDPVGVREGVGDDVRVNVDAAVLLDVFVSAGLPLGEPVLLGV